MTDKAVLRAKRQVYARRYYQEHKAACNRQNQRWRRKHLAAVKDMNAAYWQRRKRRLRGEYVED